MDEETRLERTPKLHVHAQPYWHTDSFILGDKAALAALRDACDLLLRGDASSCAFEATTSDGEGYALFVGLVEDPNQWEQLVLPYTDETLYTPPASGLIPMDAIGVARYKELHSKLRASHG